MTYGDFRDFGELYRAAFAERDPATKRLRLSEVRKALDDWQEMLQNWTAGAPGPDGTHLVQVSANAAQKGPRARRLAKKKCADSAGCRRPSSSTMGLPALNRAGQREVAPGVVRAGLSSRRYILGARAFQGFLG